MKKTLTVNLGGTVFHIDEDAYQLLDKYLTNLRIHFRKEEGSDEIMNDFEMRISELFSERIKLGYEVITIEHVEAVIERMGKPEDLFGEDNEPQSTGQGATTEGKHKHSEGKRLFRNPDDYMIGGVAGGLAAYLGWDPTLLRIALFVLMFFYGITIPIYFILWLIVPKASTAAEKLQMRGENVTVENIGKTVTDGFEKASDNINSYIKSDKTRTAFQKVMDFFVSAIVIILKVSLILLLIMILPPLLLVLFVLIVVITALIGGGIGGIGIIGGAIPHSNLNLVEYYPEAALVIASICAIIAIAISLFTIFYLLLGAIFNFKPLPTGVKTALFILWLISIIINIALLIKYGYPLDSWSGYHNWNNISLHL